MPRNRTGVAGVGDSREADAPEADTPARTTRNVFERSCRAPETYVLTPVAVPVARGASPASCPLDTGEGPGLPPLAGGGEEEGVVT